MLTELFLKYELPFSVCIKKIRVPDLELEILNRALGMQPVIHETAH